VRIVAALVLVAVAAPSAAIGSDGGVRRAAVQALPVVERAVGAGVGSGVAAQAQYDAARALEAAVPPLASVSPGCRPLAQSLLGFAGAVVIATEGVDRLDPAQVQAGRRAADAALARVDSLGRTCRSRGHVVSSQPGALVSPGPGEAFFGEVRARNRGDTARLFVNGQLLRVFHSSRANLRFRVHLRPGRYDLELSFFRRGNLVARSAAWSAFLLPDTRRERRGARSTDAGLQAQLRQVGAAFQGWAAIYTHDLRTGRTASWNADALFPAASTVKLGVLAAVLHRWRPGRLEPDLRAMTGWSSNLAANRLLRLVGDGSETLGVERVEAALARLGARSSRYPGSYRIGTSVDEPPPLATGRVTTARDLGRALYAIAAAAAGDRAAANRIGLDEHAARYALGLLLESERSGVNAGLVGGALAPGTPIAQKTGWITDVRDTAAIVYGPRGPRIVVVLAYRPGLTTAAAATLGRDVVRLAF
jgi:beta-lactamase class A